MGSRDTPINEGDLAEPTRPLGPGLGVRGLAAMERVAVHQPIAARIRRATVGSCPRAPIGAWTSVDAIAAPAPRWVGANNFIAYRSPSRGDVLHRPAVASRARGMGDRRRSDSP